MYFNFKSSNHLIFLDTLYEIASVRNVTSFLSEVYVRTDTGGKVLIDNTMFKLRERIL